MTTDPIADATALLENDLSIMLLCETCPEECNCYPPADMWRRRDNGDLICEDCAETGDMPAEDLDLAPRPADVIRALLVALEAERAENQRMREALERISCPRVTEGPLWWQEEARTALHSTEGG